MDKSQFYVGVDNHAHTQDEADSTAQHEWAREPGDPPGAPGGNGHGGEPKRSYEYTEMGNAHRLLDACGTAMRFAPGLGWCSWSQQEGVWFTGEKGEQTIRKWADAVVQHMLLEVTALLNRAAVLRDEGKDTLAGMLADKARWLMDWALRSQTAHMLTAMLKLSAHHVLADVSAFDQHP